MRPLEARGCLSEEVLTLLSVGVYVDGGCVRWWWKCLVVVEVFGVVEVEVFDGDGSVRWF